MEYNTNNYITKKIKSKELFYSKWRNGIYKDEFRRNRIMSTGITRRMHFRNGTVQSQGNWWEGSQDVFYQELSCDSNNSLWWEDRVLITGMEIGVFQRTEVGGYSLLFPLNFAKKSYI